ncbi:NAD(P)-dependent oxidoreductase [Streptomyces sp. NPDC048248]|uniref:NAD(P)-dependent oxidoreductase n=1 Tax=Streptomyces sp. NPDC048248 TaxID=3365523 RepID=UPI00371575D5
MADTENNARPPLRAGVIGLGMIGGGVAVSLSRRGRVPVIHDIRPDAADGLAGVPCPVASPAAVAQASDVIMVAVVDADQARSVLTGEGGVLSTARAGSTVVLLSTVALAVVHELSAACARAGVRFLDCGVTPGDKAAEHGMVAIVGGAPEDLAHARPVLEDWARTVVHCGPTGTGMAAKIARNVVTYGSWRVVSEAVALSRAAGVEPATLAKVLETADPAGATLLQLLLLQSTDALTPDLRRQIADLMSKDLDAALALGGDLDVSLPSTTTVRATVTDTLAPARARPHQPEASAKQEK